MLGAYNAHTQDTYRHMVTRKKFVRGSSFNQGEGRDFFEISNLRQEDGKINNL